MMTLPEMIKDMGLRIEFVYLKPDMDSKEFKEWKHARWKVWLYKEDRLILEQEFKSGIACLLMEKMKHPFSPRSIAYQDAINMALTNGCDVFGRKLRPDIIQFVYSIVSDADALDYNSFEDWAMYTGCDEDSRKAEATYKECLSIGLKLRNGLGEKDFIKLQKAARDY